MEPEAVEAQGRNKVNVTYIWRAGISSWTLVVILLSVVIATGLLGRDERLRTYYLVMRRDPEEHSDNSLDGSEYEGLVLTRGSCATWLYLLQRRTAKRSERRPRLPQMTPAIIPRCSWIGGH